MLQPIPFDYSSKSAGLLIRAIDKEPFLVDARNKIHREFREVRSYYVNAFVFGTWQEIVESDGKSHLVEIFTNDEFLFSEYLKGASNRRQLQLERESAKTIKEEAISAKASRLFLAC